MNLNKKHILSATLGFCALVMVGSGYATESNNVHIKLNSPSICDNDNPYVIKQDGKMKCNIHHGAIDIEAKSGEGLTFHHGEKTVKFKALNNYSKYLKKKKELLRDCNADVQRCPKESCELRTVCGNDDTQYMTYTRQGEFNIKVYCVAPSTKAGTCDAHVFQQKELDFNK